MSNEPPKDPRLNPDHPEDTQTPNDFKKPYHAPHLIIYGPLRDLTSGGSGGKSELNDKGQISGDPKELRP